MPRAESEAAVQEDEQRVPFDVVPRPDTRVDQGIDEKVVRTSRDGNNNGQDRLSKDEESASTAMDDSNEKEFEVTWDGDDDPMNPKSMPYARKWSIVIILSLSSLCVYVGHFLVDLLIASGRKELSREPAFLACISHGVQTHDVISELESDRFLKIALALLRSTLAPMHNWKENLVVRE